MNMRPLLVCLYVNVSLNTVDGDEVTLPCDTGTDDQRNCDSTDWLLDDLRSPLTVYLFREGQIDDEAKDKSDRLSVSENCSLVIKKVTDEDIGKYTCKQFRSGQQEGQNAVVILSVVTIWRYVIGAVVLVALLIIIIIVAVIKWKRTNGNTKRTDGTVVSIKSSFSLNILIL
uniref:Ig-like domain-containing protein n=1 Tax=Cyclopterus lumpus TaxID=8103 RepID=A0A8C2ZPK9_CYCLU